MLYVNFIKLYFQIEKILNEFSDEITTKNLNLEFFYSKIHQYLLSIFLKYYFIIFPLIFIVAPRLKIWNLFMSNNLHWMCFSRGTYISCKSINILHSNLLIPKSFDRHSLRKRVFYVFIIKHIKFVWIIVL